MEDRIEKRHSLYGYEYKSLDQRRTRDPRSYEIKQLWQRSHEIIGMALRGYKQVDIAKVLNVEPATVSSTLNSELGQEKLSKMREERDKEFVSVAKEIDKLAEKCLKVYEEILDSPNATLKLKKETADTVLMDIGGHRAPTKIDTRSMNMTASIEEIEEFKRNGIKAAKDAGFLIALEDESDESEKETKLLC